MEWNAGLYRGAHAFVFNHGESLLSVLAPQPGERILDVGCGTGELTAKIVEAGAIVTGVDASASMIAAATDAFPAATFRVMDAAAMTFETEFDAVFSNAALHWVKRAAEAADGMARALEPGGRLVLEMGGFGNVATLERAFDTALREVAGTDFESPWFFPSIGTYASLLEGAGFEVRAASLYDRPTRLEGTQGLRNWYRMFLANWLDRIGPAAADRVLARAESLCAGLGRGDDWEADYRRLRIVAVKSRDALRDGGVTAASR